MSIVRSAGRTRRGRAHRRQRGAALFRRRAHLRRDLCRAPAPHRGAGRRRRRRAARSICSSANARCSGASRRSSRRRPPPNLPAALRDEICAAAVRLAAAARYRNLGTVEFILGADGRFFFLEMNTRLQVEHPVTEMITGLDLVRAAARNRRRLRPRRSRRATSRRSGHAIECRICAEDPERDFLPETGVLQVSRRPRRRRVCASRTRSTPGKRSPPISIRCSPSSSCTAPTAREAIARAIAALDELALLGVQHQHRLSRARARRIPPSAPATCIPASSSSTRRRWRRRRSTPRRRDAALIAAALGFREFRDVAFGVPEPYASIGPLEKLTMGFTIDLDGVAPRGRDRRAPPASAAARRRPRI